MITPRKKTLAMTQKIITLYKQGLSINEIKKIVKLTNKTIADLLKYNKIQIRTHSEQYYLWMQTENGKKNLFHLKTQRWGPNNPMWKGNAIKSPHEGNLRAQRMYPCPKGYERHHIDGNQLNNSPENIMILSESEHQKLHYAKRQILSNGRFAKQNLVEVKQ
jgi:DNA-binding transcriptional MerR regulator